MAPVSGFVTIRLPSASAPSLPAASSAPALRLVGGSKSYERGRRRIPVFADVDLELRRDEIVVLLGPSGCGKSTLLRTLAGLEPLDRGRLELDPGLATPSTGARASGDGDGDPVPARGVERRPAELDREVGIAFQEPSLLPWLTVAENVALGLRFAVNRNRLPEGAPEAVTALLDELGLADLADARPDQLSGGQAQRVNVARVVLTGRPILLLDEPFAALDPATRSDLRGWLVRLVRVHRLAALLVTHDVDEAIALGDRIVLMAGLPGRVRRTWVPDGGRPLGALRDEIVAAYRADEPAHRADLPPTAILDVTGDH
ncbi:MAG TPA: ATP-binding cassette domain-containing protein [Candidatus Binatia bacterium]|nr:ATP-binding cassette domain-containing protein [Candidatus Binatia bacterium]